MQFDFYYDSDIANNRDIAKFELPVKKNNRCLTNQVNDH